MKYNKETGCLEIETNIEDVVCATSVEQSKYETELMAIAHMKGMDQMEAIYKSRTCSTCEDYQLISTDGGKEYNGCVSPGLMNCLPTSKDFGCNKWIIKEKENV